MYFPQRVHEKSYKKKLERSITRQAIAGRPFCFFLLLLLLFFFSFLNQHAILSASIISHSHLDCFDLHENRALKLYNFCI